MSNIVTRNRKQYEIPDPGPVMAVLIRIDNLGPVDTEYGPKEKIVFVWSTDAHDKNRQPIPVYQRFTKSLHPKAALYKAIRSITGENPGEQFDLDTLIGVKVQLVIEHNEVEGIVYANVAAIVRLLTREERESEAKVQKVIDVMRTPKPSSVNLDVEESRDMDPEDDRLDKTIPF